MPYSARTGWVWDTRATLAVLSMVLVYIAPSILAIIAAWIIAYGLYSARINIPKQVTSTHSRRDRLQKIFKLNASAYRTPLTRTWKWEGNKIRLLELKAGKFCDHLYGSLKVFELGNTNNYPPYIALSWAWGDVLEKKIIVVDMVRMTITIRAFEVLRRIRSQNEACYVWLDAVCINQADAAEVVQQVHQMPLIYARASRVVLWFGPCGGQLYDTDEHCHVHTHSLHTQRKANDLSLVHQASWGKSTRLVAQYGDERLQWWWRAWTVSCYRHVSKSPTAPDTLADARSRACCRSSSHGGKPLLRLGYLCHTGSVE